MKLNKLAISALDIIADERYHTDSPGHRLFSATRRDLRVAWPIVTRKAEHTLAILFAVLLAIAVLR